MTIFAVLLMAIAFVALIVFGMYFLAHAGMLFGFNGQTKITDATIAKFYSHTRYEDGAKINHTAPIIAYHNKFLGKTVEKMITNTGICPPNKATPKTDPKRIVHPGDTVKVEYTTKRVRVVDPRFVSEKTYRISRYVLPVVISAGVGFIGFVLLVICILMGQ